MYAFRNALLCLCLALAPFFGAQAQKDTDVIVVTGKRPGPPLWRVTNGANTLWILPLVPNVPRNMEWDDARVAAIIAAAEEVIGTPNVTYGVSKRTLLNPVTAIRAIHLWRRISQNPDGAELDTVLPPALYSRYTALKTAYFPDDDDVDALRPSAAGDELYRYVLKAEQLTGSQAINAQVDRHIRSNREIVQTDVEVEVLLEGDFNELSARAEAMMGSLSPEQEVACFDLRLGVLEQHLDDMKLMANAWANGSAGELEDYFAAGSLDNPCSAMLAGSSEGALLLEMSLEGNKRWLDAAQAALESNSSTFARLPLGQVIGPTGLVEQLVARGYTLHDPR